MIDPPPYSELLAFLAGRERHHPSNDLVRRAVQLRASDACEYCLKPTRDMFHIDHIIPAHRWETYISGRLPLLAAGMVWRGPHHLDNYAWSCPYCNQMKGSAISGRVGQESVRLFDPRRDIWREHFAFFHRYLIISGISPIGYATEQVLKLNDARIGGQIGPRHEAILDGTYPPLWARGWYVGAERT